MADPQSSENLPSLFSDLWQLIVAYAKQETVEPLKGIGRFVGIGIVGAILTSVGLVTLTIAGLRALQGETGDSLTGNWTWVPYAVVLVVVLAVAGFAATRIGKKGS